MLAHTMANLSAPLLAHTMEHLSVARMGHATLQTVGARAAEETEGQRRLPTESELLQTLLRQELAFAPR